MRTVFRRLFSAALVLALASAGSLVALPFVASAGDADKPAPAAKTKKEAAPPPKVVPALPLLPAPVSLDDAMNRMARIRVTVVLKEAKFEDAVEYVRRAAGFNVIVAPALSAKGTEGIVPMTIALRDVSLKQFAELIAQFSATKFKLSDGILQFTTPEDARGRPILRIYSIADVTMPLRNFPGPDINLHPSGAEFEDEAESEVAGAFSEPDKIVELIQKTIAEKTWADAEVSISADASKLIVKQYPEVHREIMRLLAMLRASR